MSQNREIKRLNLQEDYESYLAKKCIVENPKEVIFHTVAGMCDNKNKNKDKNKNKNNKKNKNKQHKHKNKTKTKTKTKTKLKIKQNSKQNKIKSTDKIKNSQ